MNNILIEIIYQIGFDSIWAKIIAITKCSLVIRKRKRSLMDIEEKELRNTNKSVSTISYE